MSVSTRTPAAILAVVVLAATLPAVVLGWRLWVVEADGILTLHGETLVVRDFITLYGAAVFLARGDLATIFTPEAFFVAERAIWGASLTPQAWPYPPPMLLLAIPMRWFGLISGAMAAIAVQAAMLLAVVRLRLPWLAGVAVLASPAFLENSLAGQNGGMTGALLAGGLLLAGTRPVLAGVLFGLLTVKPQLGLLVPVCLLASGNWRAILAAVVTTGLLVMASLVAFGTEAWAMYWTNVRPQMAGVLELPFQGLFYQREMVTPFILLRAAGASLRTAYAAQAFIGLGCILLVWRAWRDPARDPAMKAALAIVLGMIATPYGYTYDMVGVAIAVALAVQAGVIEMQRPYGLIVLLAAWVWPGVGVAASQIGAAPSDGWPAGCLVLAAFGFVLWRARG
jgi:hypothetical protein